MSACGHTGKKRSLSACPQEKKGAGNCNHSNARRGGKKKKNDIQPGRLCITNFFGGGGPLPNGKKKDRGSRRKKLSAHSGKREKKRRPELRKMGGGVPTECPKGELSKSRKGVW